MIENKFTAGHKSCWGVPQLEKRKAQGRLYNRNPAINELLREEAGSDNYDDLTNFIDPSPDISIREVRQMF